MGMFETKRSLSTYRQSSNLLNLRITRGPIAGICIVFSNPISFTSRSVRGGNQPFRFSVSRDRSPMRRRHGARFNIRCF